MTKVLALDIGGTKVAAALIDADLNITERKQFASQRNHTPESFTKFFENVVAQYDPDSYEGIAVATAGTVHKGMLNCLTPTSFGDIYNFPFLDLFQRLSQGKPVLTLNDGQAATWAEYIHAQIPNMAFITVSTGVGGGFVLNDDLYEGATNLAGHLGHMLVRGESPIKQIWRDFALVEDLASGTAIAQATADWETPCTTAEVFELQAKGDERAEKIIKTAAEAIAVCIASNVVSNDVHDFFLGGSVSIHTNFIQQVQELLNEMPEQYRARLYPAYYREDSGLVGAADYYYSRFLPKYERKLEFIYSSRKTPPFTAEI